MSGIVIEKPVLKYEICGVKFYSFFISVNRKSEECDVLPCVIHENNINTIYLNKKVYLQGEIRTRNEHIFNKSKLDIYIYVKSVSEYGEKDENCVEMLGFLCKKPIYRVTSLGKKITDLIVASNREVYGKSDYIPCICWGRNALIISDKDVGTMISIAGRLQSRRYKKRFKDGSEEIKVAYELSINTLNIIKESEKEYERE